MGAAHSCGVLQEDLELLAGAESVAATDGVWSRIELATIAAPKKGTREALDKVLSCACVCAHTSVSAPLPSEKISKTKSVCRVKKV